MDILELALRPRNLVAVRLAADKPILVGSVHTTRRVPWIWPLGLVLLALVFLLFPLSRSNRAEQALMDLCHAPLFLILAGTACWSIRRASSSRSCELGVWVFFIVFALGTEVLQHFVGRQSSYLDAIANGLGTTAGCLWMGTSFDRYGRWSLRFLAVFLIVAAMARPLWVLADVVYQQQQMPVLASFEFAWELSRWSVQDCRIERVPHHRTHGEWSLQVDFETGMYPGLAIPEVPADWTPFRELTFDVTLETPETLPLIVKITDEAHNWESDDRFHYQAQLHSGLNRIRIPMRQIERAPNGRFLNLKRMALLQLFTVQLHSPARMYLDNIRLIPDQLAEEAVTLESLAFGQWATPRD